MLEIPLVFILVSSGLLILAVLTSLIAFRIGAPLLLLFLGIGLLVGEDGLGLDFDNAPIAYFIGSIALAVILFDSGFNTRFETAARAAWPALVLATVGVLLTTGLVGVAVHYLSGLSWRASLLLGAIVSSTDAAAVFFLLRVGGIKIRDRVRATLEVESGSNDPMAVFLTATFVDMIVAGPEAGAPVMTFLQAFVMQIGLGTVLGVAGGWMIVRLVNRLKLEPGLYPVIVLGLSLFLFAVVSLINGSGFLAVYIAGMMTGNMGRQGMPLLRRFQDGLTWIAQISMFLILGLLATPSDFGRIALQGIAVAIFLIFVARPIAVWLCLLPFRFTREETAFISWVGLRGAVSILLAILPMMAAIPAGQAFFNVAFIIVLTSMMLQGWTIRPVARRLGLVVPPEIGPVEKVELELPGRATHELVVYHIAEGSPVTIGERIPRWARPSLIVRNGRSMKQQEAGQLRVGDFVYIFAVPRYVRLLDRLFASPVALEATDRDYFGDFALDGDALMSDVAHEYGIPVDYDLGETTLTEFLVARIGGDPHRGDRTTLGPVELIVRDIDDNDEIETVGLSLTPQETTLRRLPLFQNFDEIAVATRDRIAVSRDRIAVSRDRIAVWSRLRAPQRAAPADEGETPEPQQTEPQQTEPQQPEPAPNAATAAPARADRKPPTSGEAGAAKKRPSMTAAAKTATAKTETGTTPTAKATASKASASKGASPKLSRSQTDGAKTAAPASRRAPASRKAAAVPKKPTRPASPGGKTS